MQTDTTTDIKQLNSFLRGELSAVETYGQAIEKLADSNVQRDLTECRTSHARRADLLRKYISDLGGSPADGSGAWGGFAKLVEGGAKIFGDKAALAAIEEGEDHGRDDYKRGLDDLTPPARAFVSGQLLPEQERTHAVLSRLQKQMA